MNNKIEDIFIEKLKKSENNVIDKEDIIRLGEEYGLVLNKRTAKSKIVDKIVCEGYLDRLIETFKEFIYIPAWEVGKFFNMNTSEINSLKALGVITEDTKEESFYSRVSKEYYYSDTYPINVLEDYTEQELKNSYNKAYKQDEFKVRIETKSEEEVQKIINEFKKVFIVDNDPAIYERREKGFNSYLKVKIANNTELEEMRYTKEIQKLKNELKEVENEFREFKIATMKERHFAQDVKHRFGEDYQRKFWNLADAKENSRGAGRKEKFTLEKKQEILEHRAKGESMKNLAIKFNCAVGTIHKLINENR